MTLDKDSSENVYIANRIFDNCPEMDIRFSKGAQQMYYNKSSSEGDQQSNINSKEVDLATSEVDPVEFFSKLPECGPGQVWGISCNEPIAINKSRKEIVDMSIQLGGHIRIIGNSSSDSGISESVRYIANKAKKQGREIADLAEAQNILGNQTLASKTHFTLCGSSLASVELWRDPSCINKLLKNHLQ